MKKLAIPLIALTLVGCGQAGTSTSHRGDISVSTDLSRTGKAGANVKWRSHVIPVTTSEPWAISAGQRWASTGVRFVHGKAGGITFALSRARNSVGWAITNYTNGRITSCNIFANPKYLHRYSIEKTFAHELGHCLGFNGHADGNGLMSTYAREWRIAGPTLAYISAKYGVAHTAVAPTKKVNKSNPTLGQKPVKVASGLAER